MDSKRGPGPTITPPVASQGDTASWAALLQELWDCPPDPINPPCTHTQCAANWSRGRPHRVKILQALTLLFEERRGAATVRVHRQPAHPFPVASDADPRAIDTCGTRSGIDNEIADGSEAQRDSDTWRLSVPGALLRGNCLAAAGFH